MESRSCCLARRHRSGAFGSSTSHVRAAASLLEVVHFELRWCSYCGRSPKFAGLAGEKLLEFTEEKGGPIPLPTLKRPNPFDLLSTFATWTTKEWGQKNIERRRWVFFWPHSFGLKSLSAFSHDPNILTEHAKPIATLSGNPTDEESPGTQL